MSQLIFVTFDNENRASEILQTVSNRKSEFSDNLSQALVVSVTSNNRRKVEQVSKTKAKNDNWLVPLVNEIIESKESVIKKTDGGTDRSGLPGTLSRYGVSKDFREKLRLELKPHTSAVVVWLNGDQRPNDLIRLFKGDESHVLTSKVTVEEENRIKNDFRKAA